MSQVTLSSGASDSARPFRHRICEVPEKGWEAAWLWTSERINPIVVKEVRQSLKSKEFTISFGLTLIAAVGWTIIAISMMVPRIYFTPGGVPLLAGFFCILTLPLMVIIPFSAFRSLTSETEDSTFELLSISALSAQQIVHGKMASACVQIVLYLSALAPCIVLTYLLRGVSLFTILFLLGLTVAFSICETAVALMLASIARQRIVQTGISVLALAGLILALFGWLTLLIGEGFDQFVNPPTEIFLVLFAMATVVALAISLVLRAAAAAIDFPSENHSTPLRQRILGLITLSLFWIVVAIVASNEAEIALAFQSGVFIVLMAIGGLITGERGVISPRAQRTLPKTFIGRCFLTWLYPGAGLGYVFLVCLFFSVVATLGALEVVYQASFRRTSTGIFILGYLLLCYLAIYLGVTRLIMMAVSRGIPGRMIGSVALLAVLMIFAQLIPLFTVYYFNDYREFDYGWHQALNIIWTCGEALDSISADVVGSVTLLTLCAVAIFGLNLVLCTRDVMLVRVSQPPRVREEESQQQASKAAPLPVDPFAP